MYNSHLFTKFISDKLDTKFISDKLDAKFTQDKLVKNVHFFAKIYCKIHLDQFGEAACTFIQQKTNNVAFKKTCQTCWKHNSKRFNRENKQLHIQSTVNQFLIACDVINFPVFQEDKKMPKVNRHKLVSDNGIIYTKYLSIVQIAKLKFAKSFFKRNTKFNICE